MTATTEPDVDQETWYLAAETAYRERREDDRASAYLLLKKQADTINSELERLGIPAITQAVVVQGLRLQPALLAPMDPDRELYSVYAAWDEPAEAVALHASDWEDQDESPRYARLLTAPADVAAARHEGFDRRRLAQRSEPNLRALAVATGDRLNPDHLSADAYAIAAQIAGLTAAVVHLADTVTRSTSRP